MFGYITANRALLSEADKQKYEAYYCGVCHSLGAKHGNFCRTTLSWDMTFLALVLDGLNPEKKTPQHKERCLMHPKEKHPYFQGSALTYAADMNLVLTYFKCLDDWQDEKKLLRFGESKLFAPAYHRIQGHYPRQCAAVEDGLSKIAMMEKRHEMDPDRPAAAFGVIMGELFVDDETREAADALRVFGENLGRFVYFMDAVMDLKADLIGLRYNPLTSLTKLDPMWLLSSVLEDCVNAAEELPDNRNQSIIDNVLYSGVWSAFVKANPDLFSADEEVSGTAPMQSYDE